MCTIGRLKINKRFPIKMETFLLVHPRFFFFPNYLVYETNHYLERKQTNKQKKAFFFMLFTLRTRMKKDDVQIRFHASSCIMSLRCLDDSFSRERQE